MSPYTLHLLSVGTNAVTHRSMLKIATINFKNVRVCSPLWFLEEQSNVRILSVRHDFEMALHIKKTRLVSWHIPLKTCCSGRTLPQLYFRLKKIFSSISTIFPRLPSWIGWRSSFSAHIFSLHSCYNLQLCIGSLSALQQKTRLKSIP